MCADASCMRGDKPPLQEGLEDAGVGGKAFEGIVLCTETQQAARLALESSRADKTCGMHAHNARTCTMHCASESPRT